MGRQRIDGHFNVQIQGVVGSRIQVVYGGAARTVPLEPAHVPVARRLRSPARLIRAHAGVFPYVDRGALLGELEAWAGARSPFAGIVIGGRGGSGKTRLAVELCQRLGGDRWLCGFLSRIADQGMLDALIDAPIGRLVVIDYAETRPEQLELLLPLLSAKATPEHPVRVLLLVRGGSDGGGSWAERLANRVDTLDAVLDECEVRQLEETPFSVGERRALFDVALPALAEHIDPAVEPAEQPDLTHQAFESPLMVAIAAYLAAQGEEAPTNRETLLDEVLAHERRYWREEAAELGSDVDLLASLVAFATLVNPESRERAAQLLRLLPDLHDATAERRNRLSRWVHDRYPGPQWWNPLEPDLLGEHLVATTFSRQPEVLRGVLTGDDPTEITRPLEVLARAAADHPVLSNALTPIVGGEILRLCTVALAQAKSARDVDLLYGKAVTVAQAVDSLLSVVEVDSDLLHGAMDLMPPRSNLVLNGLAVRLTALAVERSRRLLAESGRTGDASDLAGSLNNLSNRLAVAGRYPEALEASEESVVAYRPLADASPAQAPNLGRALNNLSNHLSDAGRHPEALEASEESVEIRRALAKSDPENFAADLASALNNLSSRLRDMDRDHEALKFSNESVDAYRELAAANHAVYAPDLAMALNNLSVHLSDAGRHQEALDASEESVAACRALAAENPAAFMSELAGILNNHSIDLAAAGRRQEALDASEESVAAYRLLVDLSPSAYEFDLARALGNFAKRLSEFSREAEAAATRREAQKLLGEEPG